ncbi:mucin-5AC [Plutella xylostella]|uniref:mucin-5AC n=1 Tax=Plutella xylostella TaxID=51655 RepID=UPI002032DB93|nr:mucin-5AC [Plutella xylostella]XP_037978526.2 mucin-5AC [Plutella xylostella]
MRRQARITGGGALLLRTASALQVWLWLLIFVFQNEFRISRSIQPGYLDFDNLPDTNFTCEGKVIGGYYADLETSCQMFHVCTVGQQEEPMDIKFLCLNGTVFDQETRVCERVDEVDCTKSEKFYSLNLELYGNTIAPPIVPVELNKTQSTEQPPRTNQPNHADDADPSIEDERNASHHSGEAQSPDNQDTTEDPVQEGNNDEQHKLPDYHQTHTFSNHQGQSDHVEPVEENQEEEEIDSENPEYDEDYTKSPTTTTTAAPSTTSTSKPTTTPAWHATPRAPAAPAVPHALSSPSSLVSSSSHSSTTTGAASPTVDPALLSPQEFIYRHRGPGSEAISFQRQSFRPADGVYITHAPPAQPHNQFDHFQYESSRTGPRPVASRPTPYVQRPPAPFRPTTLDPRDQLSRPGPASQSSERHETSVKHRQQTYLPPLPPQRPLPFDPYYYDRKRSDEAPTEIESSLAARSVAPPADTERPAAPAAAAAAANKPKSPPRVIVTASASVSDSNGKRLNYTVGNVVSAVKPIVPINYDDYKESDLIFDPFFLDVPKLQKRRKSRGYRNSRRIFSAPATVSPRGLGKDNEATSSSVTSQATTTDTPLTTPVATSPAPTTAAAWSPDDYVDDNYEPQAYLPPAPPLAVQIPIDENKHVKNEWHPIHLKQKTIIVDPVQKFKSISSSETQSTSSQYAAGAGVRAPPPPPAHAAHPLCATTDCRSRA